MEEKIFLSQKYFIFKLSDILNNSFHIFEEKRLESLQLSIQLCLDTYEEMNSTPIGTDKLEKSYKGLLNSLAFQLKKHPFRKLDVYQMDFSRLFCLIDNKDKEGMKNSYELFMSLKSLQKKLQTQNLSCQYVACLQNQLSYSEVDALIEAFVSDLLYIGYSLNYLNEWYVGSLRDGQFYEALENKNITFYIRKLEELNGRKNTYQVIVPYQVKSDSQKDMASQLLKKHFEIKTKEVFAEFSTEWDWKEENYACKEYQAADYYKAIGMAKKEFSTDKELFSMWQNVTDVIRENVRIGCISSGKLIKQDIRKVDNTKLINYFDKNRMEQLNTFIELKDKMKNADVDTLERVLHTLHTAKGYNVQNRFLNFWSALEYSIYPFPKNSIIEKARTVVAESFTLFYIKNKMNIFWERLSYTMEKKGAETEHPKCKEFMDSCKGEKDFDTFKVVEFLQDSDKYEEVLADISFHIVLERKMRELIMLVTEPKKLKKAVSEYHDSIVHDLDCVYRLRNQLIHSAKSMDDSLEHISLRLYRYVNSIVATILYYKRHNPKVSIVEILNSLHNTYEVYMEHLDKVGKDAVSAEDGYRIVRPKYLFLE